MTRTCSPAPDPAAAGPRSAPRSARTRRGRAGAIVLILVALGAGACTSTGVVEAGDASGSDPGRSGDTSATPTTSADGPSDVVDPAPPAVGPAPSTATTCVDAPATTTPWDQGGGRIVCSAADQDGSVSSPPMTDTTIPAPTTSLVPDAGTGVVVVSATGGYDCPAGQACIDIGITMVGTIEVVGPDGAVDTAPIDTTGRAGFRLAPGAHQVTARVTTGSCQPSTVTVEAGRTADLALSCSVPLP